ncbi:MAG TPA: 3-deoxy-D-manno-octulosonic acid transferase [Terracidiphilus sp.]|jgi:3-deoxy-D-manno-octulosonic-acid transferase
MILFFYNLALLTALVLGAPWWLWRMATTQKYREGLPERLGRTGLLRIRLRQARLLKAHGERPLIWIHAVSVGEVLAVSRLVNELDAALPDYFIAVSTTTGTGQQLARERFGADRVFYCPLDLPWAIRAYLNTLQPCMIVLAETEFWPNLLSGCFRRRIPVAVVNARVSDRSWPRYRRLRWLWQPFLKRLVCVLAQSQIDADRLQAIGCAQQRVSVAGNLKFDVRTAEESDATRLLNVLRHGLRLVVAGSTLEGEEAALLEAWPLLLASHPQLALVLAPRHPDRFSAVAALLSRSGIPWIKRSAWQPQPAGSLQSLAAGQLVAGQIVLLDTIGELASVYSLASVAFVGGSLVPAGGHNPLEPAQFSVPIVMGPHYANFRAIVDDLRAHDAIQVATPENFAQALVDLLTDREEALAMGQRARQVFDQQAGATERCVAALTALLSSQPAAESIL